MAEGAPRPQAVKGGRLLSAAESMREWRITTARWRRSLPFRKRLRVLKAETRQARELAGQTDAAPDPRA